MMQSRFGFSTNHFGISEEELEYDENDPSWSDNSPGSNVLIGKYDSAKPFVEKLQRFERVLLEEEVAEWKARREAIRQEVYRDFDQKRKEHMAKLKPKPQPPLILEQILTARKRQQQQQESLTSRHDVPKAEFTSRSFEGTTVRASEVSQPVSAFESLKSVVSSANASQTTNTPFFSGFAKSTSKTAAVSPIFAAVPATPSKSFVSPFASSKRQQPEITFSFTLPPQSSSTPIVSPEAAKSGHAVLTRTDSLSSCRSTASRSTSWPLQQIAEESVANGRGTVINVKASDSEIQYTSEALEATESDSFYSALSSEPSAQIIRSRRQSHPVYEEEIAFATDFMANIDTIPKSIKNLLKMTIKEKISISTKKYAKQDDVVRTIRFFSNLLTGVTVYGFNDKMINLKDDEVAIHFAMVQIIDTYMDLLPQDLSYLRVIVAVLSRLVSSSTVFSKLLFGKLFIASPLLAVNHDGCIRCILDQKEHSERFAEAMAVWNGREIAIIRLFIALITLNRKDYKIKQASKGLGTLWTMIAVTVSKETPFGAVLVAEILKECGKAMYQLYGRQMVKLVTLISTAVLPRWKVSLKELGTSNSVIRSVAEQYLTTLKYTVDDCLASYEGKFKE